MVCWASHIIYNNCTLCYNKRGSHVLKWLSGPPSNHKCKKIPKGCCVCLHEVWIWCSLYQAQTIPVGRREFCQSTTKRGKPAFDLVFRNCVTSLIIIVNFKVGSIEWVSRAQQLLLFRAINISCLIVLFFFVESVLRELKWSSTMLVSRS